MIQTFKPVSGNTVIRLLFLTMGMLLGIGAIKGQPANVTLNSANTTGTYTATQSIVLSPGFSANGSAGAFRAYIVPPPITNCVALNATPSASQNYISTFTPRQPFTDATTLTEKNTCEVMQTIQYVDGLGRPLQTVQVKGNPDATRDVIMPIAYDQFGREATKYLPYTTATGIAGSYRANALADASGFYANGEQYGFYHPSTAQNYLPINTPSASTALEPSPLNRVVEQGAPGDPWQLSGSGITGAGHTNKIVYASNNASGPGTGSGYWAKQFGVNIDASTGARTLVDQGSYVVNQLYVTISQDENWQASQSNLKLNTTEEYKDKEGHVVLKRTYNYNTATTTTEVLSTYYVYDDLGNLAFVLPPKAEPDNGLSSSSNQAILDNLCYQYQYDQRNRLVQKRVPGRGGWDYMVYNKLDQVVATQDPVQRGKPTPEWAFTKYDALGRVIQSGLWNNGTSAALSRTDLQAIVDGQTGNLWESRPPGSDYTTSCWPTTWATTLGVNYYDDYNLPVSNPYPYLQNTQITGMPATNSAMTKGLLTASLTAVLNTVGNATPDMLWAVNYYDDNGRLIQTAQQHYLGGTVSATHYDRVSNGYDFTNAVTQSIRNHYNTSGTTPAVTIANTYVYDHMGRKRQSFEQINGGTNVILSQNDYNEVGQQYIKHQHSTNNGASFLQSTTYAYNERGWLLKSSAPLFEEQLQYNSVGNVPGISPIQQFNGNIASQSWGTLASPDTKSYTYSYDNINRLTAGISTSNFNYNESGIRYDKAGNITNLQRTWGSATNVIDNLTYNYVVSNNPTNQLQDVTDASGDAGINGYKTGFHGYQYDPNGNMTNDNSKGLTITYNLLNLPQTNTLSTGAITYIYDASGKKLRKVSTLGNGTTTDYISGIQYNNGTIDFVQTEEGRALNLTGTVNYEYTLTDHLGNSRVTFDSNSGANAAKQVDDYMPFGMDINASLNGAKNEYLYNKKELQEELGVYDYGARFYDPVIARWGSLDPKAEKYYGITPFAYAANNPALLIDPDGRDIDLSNLTDDENKAGLVKFWKTKNGQAYLANYLKKGQSISVKIGKKSFVFTNSNKDGKLANDILALGSAKFLGANSGVEVAGVTIERKFGGEKLNEDKANQSDPTYDVSKHLVVHQIWVLDHLSADQSASVFGHEAFVHDYPKQDMLIELRKELNDGTIQPGTPEYGRKLDLITTSGDADHKKLANGQVNAYKNYSLQLDQIDNTTKFIQSYNSDVKFHEGFK